jgi:hypothetical protein
MEHGKCKKCQGTAGWLFGLSLISLLLAGLVSLFDWNLWLAGTQWILIAILLAIYSLITEKRDR